MYTAEVRSQSEPKEIETGLIPGSGKTEVWIRRDIRQECALSDGQPEYAYEEVYFQTDKTPEEIRADPESFWAGKEWKPNVPETDKQKIARLEQELDQARKESDMAVAELTMVIASMMEVHNV